MYGLEYEDDYLEAVRERREKRSKDAEDVLFLDEEVEKIETKSGCPIGYLGESDLAQIVEDWTDRTVIAARWDARYCGIVYTYIVDA